MIALETQGIRKEFGTLVAVNDLSLSVRQGEVWGLIGPNGAGKTTLLRMLATVLRPSAGSASICGHDLTSGFLEIRKHIGYLPDFFGLYNDLTLRECLWFFAKAYGMPEDGIGARVDEALGHVELSYKQDDLVRHLSRGMVQRLGVATLMVHDPRLFLLDEPASGLDPKARIQLRDVLRKLSGEGRTVVISSHILTELSGFCSHIAVMDHGNLITHGAVDEIEKEVIGGRKCAVTILGDAVRAKDIAASFAGVTSVVAEGDRLVVEISGDPEQLAGLNAFLVQEGVSVIGLAEEHRNLEDLFMEISEDKGLSVAEGSEC